MYSSYGSWRGSGGEILKNVGRGIVSRGIRGVVGGGGKGANFLFNTIDREPFTTMV